MKEEKCLFVDLDGTLIKSDLLFECLVPIIKNYFSLFLSLLFNLWLIVSNEKVFLDNLIYSSTLVLLDNKIVDVTQNGIHFLAFPNHPRC